MAEASLDAYRTWAQDSVSELVRAWAPEAGRRRYEALSAEFARRTTDEEASRRYAEACPVSASSSWYLRQVDDASEVEAAFADAYRDFNRARPDLVQAVPPATPAELAECARAGVLYVCCDGGDFVGAVAAKPDAQYGVDAWLMSDIVLVRAQCGKGLAPVLQRAVLDRLDSGRAPCVAGTIDAKNQPSLRTALRVGRRVVGSWVFVHA